MANKQAWTDRETFISFFKNLKGCIANFKIYMKSLIDFKTEVLDDPERKAELVKLIAEDPDLTLTKIQNKLNEFKAIYEYLNE